MDIAGMSQALSQMKTGNAVGMAMLKKTMDVATEMGDQMTQMMAQNVKAMETSVNPHIGGNINITI